jgi:hypothetical protein
MASPVPMPMADGLVEVGHAPCGVVMVDHVAGACPRHNLYEDDEDRHRGLVECEVSLDCQVRSDCRDLSSKGVANSLLLAEFEPKWARDCQSRCSLAP